jgi:hypothetical protein
MFSLRGIAAMLLFFMTATTTPRVPAQLRSSVSYGDIGPTFYIDQLDLVYPSMYRTMRGIEFRMGGGKARNSNHELMTVLLRCARWRAWCKRKGS